MVSKNPLAHAVSIGRPADNMARSSAGRGRGEVGGRGSGRSVGEAGGRAEADLRGSGRSVGEAGGRGSGRSVGEAGGRGSGRSVGEAGGRGSGRTVGEADGQGGVRGVGEGGGRGSGRGGGESGSRGQMHDDPIDDDEPIVAVGRGPVIPAPLPTPENRTWIWVENEEFNIHDKVSRTIGSNLKSMWSGPWMGWKDVPSHHRERLFERFQQYYRWEDKSKSLIHSCWEKCIKGKFPDLLKRARDKAKTLAIHEGMELENDLTPILSFKPPWISQECWEALVEAWNTNTWKDKSAQNSENRGKAIGGRHTLGSKSYVTVRKNMEKTLKRRAQFGEFWLQTHAKKGSRPLDRLAECSRSVEHGSGEVDDVEEINEEHNVTWVDTRASESYSTYNKHVIEKYGDDTSIHPEIDMELWSQTAGGKKKGRLYGTGNIADPCVVLTGAPSMPITHGSYPQDKSDNDEVQQLKEKIAELEEDKLEKRAMMEKIEESERLYAEMNEKIRLLLQNLPQNPPQIPPQNPPPT